MLLKGASAPVFTYLPENGSIFEIKQLLWGNLKHIAELALAGIVIGIISVIYGIVATAMVFG